MQMHCNHNKKENIDKVMPRDRHLLPINMSKSIHITLKFPTYFKNSTKKFKALQKSRNALLKDSQNISHIIKQFRQGFTEGSRALQDIFKQIYR